MQHKTAFSADVSGSRRPRLPKPLQPHREIESPPSNRMLQVRCNKMQAKNGSSVRVASSERRDAPRLKIFQKTAANQMIPSFLFEIGFVCPKENLSPASPSAKTSATHSDLDPQRISPNRRFICVHLRPIRFSRTIQYPPAPPRIANSERRDVPPPKSPRKLPPTK